MFAAYLSLSPCLIESLGFIQVEVGPGWLALGRVLWKLLDNCKIENDVHNAKIVMMLSQVILL